MGHAAEPEAYGSAFHVSNSGIGIDSFKAEDRTELLAQNLGLVIIDDKSDTWSHDIRSFREEIGRPTLVCSNLVDNGPVSRRTRQRFHWKTSEIGAAREHISNLRSTAAARSCKSRSNT